jgi:hypothetical protein
MIFIKLLIVFFMLLSASFSQGNSTLPNLNLQSITHDRIFSWDWNKAKQGTVLIFLSSICPCSNAHIEYIEKISQEFKNYTFIGIHSNANEKAELAKKYFLEKNISFEIVIDNKSEWANLLKALRTPHAYIINKKGEIIYEGGVTGSSDPSRANIFYLKSALTNYQNGTPLISNKTRVLGCNIRRH